MSGNNVHSRDKFSRGCYNHNCRDDWKLKGSKRALETQTHDTCKIFLISPCSPLQLPCMGPCVVTWDGQEVIHRGDVIHSLCQHSDLLFPLVFEDIHVVLGNFALRPCSQCESGVDDLFVRNNPWHTDYTHQKRNKQVRDHVETLDLAASADKGILGVWEDNQNMKDGVGYQILVFCLLFVF